SASTDIHARPHPANPNRGLGLNASTFGAPHHTVKEKTLRPVTLMSHPTTRSPPDHHLGMGSFAAPLFAVGTAGVGTGGPARQRVTGAKRFAAGALGQAIIIQGIHVLRIE